MLATIAALAALAATPQDCVKSHTLPVMTWAPCTGILIPPKDAAAALKAQIQVRKLEESAVIERERASSVLDIEKERAASVLAIEKERFAGRETVLRMERDAARAERDAQAKAAELARKDPPLSAKRVVGVVVAGAAAAIFAVLCAEGEDAGCVGSGLAAGLAVGLVF